MTDTAEIRARHVEIQLRGGVRYPQCAHCGLVYPCDAIRLCVALDEALVRIDRGTATKVAMAGESLAAIATIRQQAAEIERLRAENADQEIEIDDIAVVLADAHLEIRQQSAEIEWLRVLPTRDEIAAKISNHLAVFDTVMNVRAESSDIAAAIHALLTERQT